MATSTPNAAVRGATTYIWGTPTGFAAPAVVTAFSYSQTHRNTGEVTDEYGNLIEDRRDDVETTGSMTLQFDATFVEDTSIPLDDTNVTIDGTVYYITGRSLTRSNNGFAEWSVDFRTTEHITVVVA